MKVIHSYFIFYAFITYAVAFPYGSQSIEGGVSEKVLSKTSVSHEPDQRGKRQFYLSFVDSYENSNNNEPSQQFFDHKAPVIFNQRRFSQPGISSSYSNENQQYLQLNGNDQHLDSNENIQERQLQNHLDQLITPSQRSQWFPASGSRLIATNLRWNKPSSISTYQQTDPYNQQFSRYRQINFNEPLQPIKFTNKSPSPNYQSNNYQADLSPFIHTSNGELLYFPSSSGRTLNQDSPIQPAHIYYDTQNIKNANPNIRQIIPTPQELVNSAWSIGSNFIQRVPGYKLTTNTIGLLSNITRLGAQYFANNGLPILSPDRPNFLFPFQNRPLDLPPPYDTRYPTVSTIAAQPETTTTLVTNKPMKAADDPTANDNYDQPGSNSDNYHKGSHENSNDSHRDESNDNNQHYSQENYSSSNKNSQEDRIQTEGHSVTAQGSASEEENSEPSDNSSQVVASDVLPDEDYGIADDDDKIDTKSIKSVLG